MLDQINSTIKKLKNIDAKNFLKQMQDDISLDIIGQSRQYYKLFSDKKLLLWLEKEQKSTLNPIRKRECKLLISHFILGQIEHNHEMAKLFDEYEILHTKRMLARSPINKSSNPDEYKRVYEQEKEIGILMAVTAQKIICLRLEMSKQFGYLNYTHMHHACFLSDHTKWSPFFSMVLKESLQKSKTRQERVIKLTGIKDPWCSIKRLEEMISHKFENLSPLDTLREIAQEMDLGNYLNKIKINFVPGSTWVNLAVLNVPEGIVIHMGDMTDIEVFAALYHEFGHALAYMVCPLNWAFFYEPYLLETPSVILDWVSNCRQWQEKYLTLNQQEKEIFDLCSINKLPEVMINASKHSLLSSNIFEGMSWQKANEQVLAEMGEERNEKSEDGFFLSREIVNPFFQLNYIIGFYLTPILYRAFENKYGNPISEKFGTLLLKKLLKPGNSIAPRERIWALLDSLSYKESMPKELEDVINSLG